MYIPSLDCELCSGPCHWLLHVKARHPQAQQTCPRPDSWYCVHPRQYAGLLPFHRYRRCPNYGVRLHSSAYELSQWQRCSRPNSWCPIHMQARAQYMGSRSRCSRPSPSHRRQNRWSRREGQKVARCDRRNRVDQPWCLGGLPSRYPKGALHIVPPSPWSFVKK